MYTCIVSNHHAILDGWSNPVLFGYIHETYLKLQSQEPIQIMRDRSYEDAQRYLQEHQNDNQEYWEKSLEKIEERGDLSGLLSSKNRSLRLSDYKQIKEEAEQTLIVKDDLYHALKQLSHKEGVTLNAILQYAWHKVLSIYSHNRQTVVGTTVSGRNLPIENIESSVGLYINTLPLIVEHEGKKDPS